VDLRNKITFAEELMEPTIFHTASALIGKRTKSSIFLAFFPAAACEMQSNDWVIYQFALKEL